jgi:hypothetical protein
VSDRYSRRLFSGIIGSAALAGSAAFAETARPRDRSGDVVNAKEFGAVGNGTADDTAALQACLDHCFGPAGRPNGTNRVHNNKVFYLPSGRYKISAPLTVTYLHGGRILGAGRFVSQIENVTPGSSVFVTNGCGYSHFEGLRLTAAAGGKSFDLDWDRSAGGPALQSNTFADMFFDGGSVGVEIGHSGFMGSENLFLNCFWLGQKTAGLLTSNFNALQQTIIGGNFQGCGRAIFVGAGSVPAIEGVGFQTSGDCDIYTGSLANNSMSVSGCRSESRNFINNAGGQSLHVSGCSHVGSANGYFLTQVGGFGVISSCISTFGSIIPWYWATMRLENSQFNRDDWLQADASKLWWKPNNNRTFCLEIENVHYGAQHTEIRRQRVMTPDGQALKTYDYNLSEVQ